MTIIGTCSNCGGEVRRDETVAGSPATCAACGAVAVTDRPMIRTEKALPGRESTVEQVIQRWAPEATGSLEDRMRQVLLKLNGFELDYRRVLGGGNRVTTGKYPLVFPERQT